MTKPTCSAPGCRRLASIRIDNNRAACRPHLGTVRAMTPTWCERCGCNIDRPCVCAKDCAAHRIR